jgi:hypothetical protein
VALSAYPVFCSIRLVELGYYWISDILKMLENERQTINDICFEGITKLSDLEAKVALGGLLITYCTIIAVVLGSFLAVSSSWFRRCRSANEATKSPPDYARREHRIVKHLSIVLPLLGCTMLQLWILFRVGALQDKLLKKIGDKMDNSDPAADMLFAVLVFGIVLVDLVVPLKSNPRLLNDQPEEVHPEEYASRNS